MKSRIHAILTTLLLLLVPTMVQAAREGFPVALGDTLRNDSVPVAASRQDTLKVDTLHEVVVEGVSVMQQINRDLKRDDTPRTLNASDVLDMISPGLTDKIMHPFAFKQRKKERKRKKVEKMLDEMEMKEKLEKEEDAYFMEIIRQQRKEDEAAGRGNWKQVDEMRGKK